MPTSLNRVESFSLGEFGTRVVQVAGTAGVPATGARAVMLNVVASNTTTAGTFLTVWPGGTRPQTSNLHPIVGEPVSNTMIVPLASDGSLSVYNHWGSVSVTVSVNGYFVDDTSGAGGFVPLPPTRIINTEYSVPIPADGTLDVKVRDVAGVAADARAVFVNLTAGTPAADGYIMVTPRGSTNTPRPVLSFAAGPSVSNTASITPDAQGYVTVHNKSTATLHIVLDAQGYFNATTTTGEVFTPSTARVYDTRAAGVGQIPANGVVDIALDGVGDLPNGLMTSVFANILVLDPSTTGNTRVWSAGDSEPTLNSTIFHKNENRASLVATKVSDAEPGSIRIRNVSSGPIDLAVDIQGWFMPGTAEPPDETDPTPPGDPTAPAMVRGKFTQPDGSPAPGFTVKVYPSVDIPDGQLETMTPLVEATTGADGSWSATLPALSSELQAVADANSGVLNVVAEAEGSSSDGRPFLASIATAAAIPTAGPISQAASDVQASTEVEVAAFVPLRRSHELSPPPTVEQTTDPQTEENDAPEIPEDMQRKFLSSRDLTPTPKNPYIIGSVDYSNATVTTAAGDYTGTGEYPAGAVPAAGGCSYEGQRITSVVGRHVRYMATGIEGHAYWDAKAGASYNRVANTESTRAISVNLMDTWKVEGKSTIGNQWSFNIGYAGRPAPIGKKFKVPFRWVHTRSSVCRYTGYPYYQLMPKYVNDRTWAEKAYVPNGGVAWKDGTDTRSKDGPTNYQKAAYKVGHPPYSLYYLDKGRSSTTSGGSTILGFNATLSTGLSTNRRQTIHMGSRTSRLHWVFANASLSEETRVKVFYSW